MSPVVCPAWAVKLAKLGAEVWVSSLKPQNVLNICGCNYRPFA